MVRSPRHIAPHWTWQPIDPDLGGLRRAAPWVYQVVVLPHDHAAQRPEPLAQLRAARLQAGLPQRQLAALLGVHKATVCRWEAGDSPIRDDVHQRWLAACAAHTSTPNTEKETQR